MRNNRAQATVGKIVIVQRRHFAKLVVKDMTRRKSVTGVCRICGQYGVLSFEHVPPQEAFNKSTVIEYTLESWAAKRSIKGKQHQGGVGQYTLCETCNNNTGSWYGGEYVKWSRIGFDVLTLLSQHASHFANIAETAVSLKNVYPLRFLKQAATFFFSVINSPQAEFAKHNPDLVKFVLDRSETNLPADCQFYLRLYKQSSPETTLRRYSLAGKIDVISTKDQTGAIKPFENGGPSAFSEFSHPPFMLIMTHGTKFPNATNITYFKDYQYDDEVELTLVLKIGESASPLPGSFC
jgi:hypothetical protein